jgi:hypothetical protein
MTPAEAIYVLCAVTSLVSGGLLLRYYLARRTPLLLWSCIGFIGLAVNNVLVYVDLVLVPDADLQLWRTVAGAGAMLAMVYGLIWEADQ